MPATNSAFRGFTSIPVHQSSKSLSVMVPQTTDLNSNLAGGTDATATHGASPRHPG